MTLIIKHEGDTWRVIGEGATREGKTYCHLASTTRSRQQRNGANPIQMADWIDNNLLLSAAIQKEESQRDAITAYYEDRNNSGLAALAK